MRDAPSKKAENFRGGSSLGPAPDSGCGVERERFRGWLVEGGELGEEVVGFGEVGESREGGTGGEELS